MSIENFHIFPCSQTAWLVSKNRYAREESRRTFGANKYISQVGAHVTSQTVLAN